MNGHETEAKFYVTKSEKDRTAPSRVEGAVDLTAHPRNQSAL